MEMLRLIDTSDIATVIHSHAATITDNYWVKSVDEDSKYADIEFKEDIDMNYVANFIMDRYMRIETEMQVLQLDQTQEIKLQLKL